MSRDIITKELLKHFVFVIIPMMNPDGVVRGAYRTDTKPRDLNRVYHILKHSEHPGPHSAMEIAKQLARDNRLFAVIDTHAHSLHEGAFVYGNYLDYIEEKDRKQKKLECQLFAKLFDIYSKHFDLWNCSFGSPIDPNKPEDREKIGVGKTEIGKATGCHLCFTCESGYHKGCKEPGRYTKGNKSNHTAAIIKPIYSYQMKVQDFEDVGESIRDVLLEMIRAHPVSILQETYFNSYEEVIEEAEEDIQKKKETKKHEKEVE